MKYVAEFILRHGECRCGKMNYKCADSAHTITEISELWRILHTDPCVDLIRLERCEAARNHRPAYESPFTAEDMKRLMDSPFKGPAEPVPEDDDL